MVDLSGTKCVAMLRWRVWSVLLCWFAGWGAAAQDLPGVLELGETIEVGHVRFVVTEGVAGEEDLRPQLETYVAHMVEALVVPEEVDAGPFIDAFEAVVGDLGEYGRTREQRESMFRMVCESKRAFGEGVLRDGITMLLIRESEAIAYEQAGGDLPGFGYNRLLDIYQASTTSSTRIFVTDLGGDDEQAGVHTSDVSVVTIVVEDDETFAELMESGRRSLSSLDWRVIPLHEVAEMEVLDLMGNFAPSGVRYFHDGLGTAIPYRVLLEMGEEALAETLLTDAQSEFHNPPEWVELRMWPAMHFGMYGDDVLASALSMDRYDVSFLEMNRFVDEAGLEGMRRVLLAVGEAGTREHVTHEVLDRIFREEADYPISERIDLYSQAGDYEQGAGLYAQLRSDAMQAGDVDGELYALARIYEAALLERSRRSMYLAELFARAASDAGRDAEAVYAHLALIEILLMYIPRDEAGGAQWAALYPGNLAGAVRHASPADVRRLVNLAGRYGFDLLDDSVPFDLLRAFAARDAGDAERLSALVESLQARAEQMNDNERALFALLVAE